MINQTRPLPDNPQHSQETDIHATGGIQTHNPSKRAAADSYLRPRGNWDRHPIFSTYMKPGLSRHNEGMPCLLLRTSYCKEYWSSNGRKLQDDAENYTMCTFIFCLFEIVLSLKRLPLKLITQKYKQPTRCNNNKFY